MASVTKALRYTDDDAADELLASDPLALLIGMVLDQQVPLEWAFKAPMNLKERLGGRLDVAELASMGEDKVVAVFCDKPALHRFPASMARRVYEMCQIIIDEYDGKPENIWATATSGAELLTRVQKLPGFGKQKAMIFVALLGKRLGVAPEGWREAAGPFGNTEGLRSVADVDSRESLLEYRAYKRELKAKARAEKAAKKAVTG
jgi:uncharacterized HhH-GPD family protein